MATKVTDLSALTSTAVNDVFHIVDVSDTTHDAAGTSKKVSIGTLSNGLDKNANESITDTNSFEFNHNLGRYASITLIDSEGVESRAQVTHSSVNQVTVEFSPNFTGTIFAS